MVNGDHRNSVQAMSSMDMFDAISSARKDENDRYFWDRIQQGIRSENWCSKFRSCSLTPCNTDFSTNSSANRNIVSRIFSELSIITPLEKNLIVNNSRQSFVRLQTFPLSRIPFDLRLICAFACLHVCSVLCTRKVIWLFVARAGILVGRILQRC